MMLLFLAQAVFTGNQACAPCHKAIFESYQRTPMAQSSGAVTGDEDSETAKVGKLDPKLDTRIIVGPYGIIVNPLDNSIWGSTDEVEVPGQIFRIDRGTNPPEK